MIDDYDHPFSDLPPLVWNIARYKWLNQDWKLSAFYDMASIGPVCFKLLRMHLFEWMPR